MKYLFLILCFAMIGGCVKDWMTSYDAYLINNTGHSIKILFYKNGIVQSSDTIKLKPNETFKFAEGSERGTNENPGFSSKYFGSSNDSNVVIFDDLFRMPHYANTPTNLSSKHYLNISHRNISNPLSYRFELESSGKRHKVKHHYYEFSEQDFLYAKD